MVLLKAKSGTPPPDLVVLMECLADGAIDCIPVGSAAMSAVSWLVFLTPGGDKLWIEEQVGRGVFTWLYRIRDLGLPLTLDRLHETAEAPVLLFRLKLRGGGTRLWGVTPAAEREVTLSPRSPVMATATVWLTATPSTEHQRYKIREFGVLAYARERFPVRLTRSGEQVRIQMEEGMETDQTIPVRICVGSLELSVAQLGALRPGVQLEFTLPPELAVVVQCNGVDWALGELTWREGEAATLTITQQLYTQQSAANSDYSSEGNLHRGENHV